MKKALVFSAIRHFLTVGAGYLANKGFIEKSQGEGIASAVLVIIVAVLSYLDKKKHFFEPDDEPGTPTNNTKES